MTKPGEAALVTMTRWIPPWFVCTLRAAIQEANNVPGLNTINFNIPGSGVQTISPTAPLPIITDPVVIDGGIGREDLLRADVVDAAVDEHERDVGGIDASDRHRQTHDGHRGSPFYA